MITALIIGPPLAILAGIAYRKMRQSRQDAEEALELLRDIARR